MTKLRLAAHKSGFTLIEMMLVIGIMSVLMTIASVLLVSLIPKASVFSGSEVLVSDLRQQQAKAMVGEAESAAVPQDYGVRLETQKYTLFRGQTFVLDQVGNFVVAVDQPLSLTTTFPNQQIIFAKGSGEILNYDANADTISITQSGETTTLELNRYGVITNIN